MNEQDKDTSDDQADENEYVAKYRHERDVVRRMYIVVTTKPCLQPNFDVRAASPSGERCSDVIMTVAL